MSKRLPRFEDVTGLDRLTGADYCHRRGLLAYAVNSRKGIVLRDVNSSKEQILHATGIAEGGPVFSPEGDRIAFLAVESGSGRQVYVHDLVSGETMQVSRHPGVAMDIQWSPDGRRIAFARVVDHSSVAQKDEPIVIEDFGYKFDGRGYIHLDEHMQLFVADLDAHEERCVGAGNCDYLHHTWMPDSRHLVCEGDRFRSKGESLGYDLLRIDVETGEVERLSEGLWLVSYPNPVRPITSPDGQWIYAGVLDPACDTRNHDIYPEVYFYRFATNGDTAPQRVFYGDEQCYQCVQFPYNACGGWGLEKARISEDGRLLYYVSGWQGQCNIYVLDLSGDGHARLLAGGKQVYHGLGPVQGSKMMVSKVTATTPEAYYLMDTETGRLEQCLYQSAQEYMDDVYIQPTDDFFLDAMDGCGRIHGYAIPPYHREPGRKYPVILYIHGGPTPFYTYGLTLEHHALAAEGFGVIFCNPRGSTGYGWDHQNVEGDDLDRCCYTDLLQFVQEAARRYDWMDADRVGVTGGSFGGYMTNYLATHCKRFKAYVTQRSVTNRLIGYASSDLQGSSARYNNYEEFMIAQLRESPVALAERIDRPMLILHGMEDYRVPVEGAHQFYTAIKDIHPDLPVRMVLFPHTGHEQPGDPGQARVYYQEMVDWFRAYL